MMRLQRRLGEVIAARPRRRRRSGRRSGHRQPGNTPNTGRFNIVLKPRDERELDAVADHRPSAAATRQGHRSEPVPQPAQDITVGGRIARGSFQYTCRTRTSPS